MHYDVDAVAVDASSGGPLGWPPPFSMGSTISLTKNVGAPLGSILFLIFFLVDDDLFCWILSFEP
jgi:hypothetical protein